MEQVASQSDNVQEVVIEDDDAALTDAFEAFGISKPKATENASEDEEDGSETNVATQETEKPKLKVKFNKEDVEVDEDKIPEYVQKGLALDKERERRSEYEKALDRVAKQQGYKDHADLIANLDKIEQEQSQKQEQQHQELRQELRQQAEDWNMDPDKIEEYLDNHPLMQQAKKVLKEQEEARIQSEQAKTQQEWASKWDALYKAHPDLMESAKAFERGESPAWYNEEMQSLVSRGYDPIHAYTLAHRDTIQQQSRKQMEQKLLKEQRLGTRAQVETDARTEREPEVDPELSSAFSLFGLDPRRAKKYAKK